MNPDNQETFDIQGFLQTLTTRPGVYRMLDEDGRIIYVGKARNLKRRVSSYFQRRDDSPKTRSLVAQIRSIEVTVTHTEGEALLLENNLIKKHRPRYNVLLRDDKSYPYIFLSEGPFPRLGFHRGRRRAKGRYFGPFPNTSAVRESLSLLQKIFPVRQCEDSYFANRNRPCLQYQIKRCTGPCVKRVDEAGYQEDVRHSVMFLEGKSSQVIDELVQRMEQASERLEFEQAARYRDQIVNLRRVQEKQYVSGERGDLDVLAVHQQAGISCVQVFFIRGGRNLGNRLYYPQHTTHAPPPEVIGAFIAQYYLANRSDRLVPPELLLNVEPEDRELLEQVLGERAGRKVAVTARVRGDRARWVEMAVRNAEHALKAHLATRSSQQKRFEALQEELGLSELPRRIECFDISHTQGEATVASCVVFDNNGPLKSDYRRFNIENITPGDDYAAMHQALTRRFRRLKEEDGKLPDLLLIDGGKGQITQAEAVLGDLQVAGVTLVGVAKGASRRPGLEQLIISGHNGAVSLPPDSPALHLIQHVRDEAHRFAIAGHRQRRAKSRRSSPLEAIEGLGPKRRQQLLRQFGGLQEVVRAGVEDLSSVHGISRQLAQRIYDTLHPDEK
ncbi:excinuclease ABC subunit UvrC [Thiohalomonas denitrificans]|uniref:UvrABC system protein C n=1 Tax=Thiohalomonas denitrificans TaxID=415747 RepID=A0A1G5QBA1_9GAMM|nr:excinuclease ABC subunit UvrC [Thiohalomonas denitrificans]SCZ58977.1 Excinuclease ABC subunit C [Thiohalomonas denitrificans]